MLIFSVAFAQTPAAPAPVAAPPPDPAALYATECGACHLAYPARFLPLRSWNALMGGLSSHFGEDASLSAEVRGVLLTWLASDAADLHRVRIPADQTPLRITELSWFRGEHREAPAKVIREVGSLARCDACHTGARQGRYGESELVLPGMGRWEEEDDD